MVLAHMCFRGRIPSSSPCRDAAEERPSVAVNIIGLVLGFVALKQTKNRYERGYITRGLLMNAAPLTVVGLVVLLILLIYGFFYLISLF